MPRSIKKGPFIRRPPGREDRRCRCGPEQEEVIKTWSRRSTITPRRHRADLRRAQRSQVRPRVRHREHGRSQARRVRADPYLPRSLGRQRRPRSRARAEKRATLLLKLANAGARDRIGVLPFVPFAIVSPGRCSPGSASSCIRRTRTVDLSLGNQGLDFLGCHLRKRMSGPIWVWQGPDPPATLGSEGRASAPRRSPSRAARMGPVLPHRQRGEAIQPARLLRLAAPQALHDQAQETQPEAG